MRDKSISQAIRVTVTQTGAACTQQTLHELDALAKTHYAAIVAGEKCADRYWQLGQVLRLLRPEFSKGTWETKLAELEIDKSRASRACRIAKKYASAEECAGMTIREALGPPPRRKPVKLRQPKSAAAAEDQLLDFLNYVNTNAATLKHEARRVDPVTANGLLVILSFGLGHLQEISRSLMHQARGTGLSKPCQGQVAHSRSSTVASNAPVVAAIHESTENLSAGDVPTAISEPATAKRESTTVASPLAGTGHQKKSSASTTLAP